MSNWENEVFYATVGGFTRKQLAKWGDDLGDRVTAAMEALDAAEVGIRLEITVTGDEGSAEFKRRTSQLVWPDEEYLAEAEAAMEAEEATA